MPCFVVLNALLTEYISLFKMLVVVLSTFTKQRNPEIMQHAELLPEKIETVFLEHLLESVSNHAYNYLIFESYARMARPRR